MGPVPWPAGEFSTSLAGRLASAAMLMSSPLCFFALWFLRPACNWNVLCQQMGQYQHSYGALPPCWATSPSMGHPTVSQGVATPSSLLLTLLLFLPGALLAPAGQSP